MEKVRKKTIDAATEKLLVAAAKQGIDLSWDRYESEVPLCGFGRLSLCCNICSQGPCRINPFAEKDEPTICGRTRENVVAANFLRLISDGTASIIKMAGDSDKLPAVIKERVVDKELLPGPASQELVKAIGLYTEGVAVTEDYFQAAARLALAGYASLAASSVDSGIYEVEAGVGALKADQANLLLLGAICGDKVAALKAAAKGVNVVAMCGAEGHGTAIPGNYASQETLLFSGLIDAVVCGNACVSAGFLSVAAELDIPVFCAETDDLDEAVNTARANFKQRQDEKQAEFAAEQAAVGYSKESFKQVKAAKMEALLSKYPVKGVAILGGCNNVKTTQDQSIVLQAKELVANDVLVVATGCAAAALAKAGMMDADKANHFASPGLVAFLGALAAAAGIGRLPAVLHGGTCWQTPVAVELASIFGLPIYASFPEISLPAAWSTAVALAAMGIPTYVGPVLPVEGTPAAVSALATVLDGNLIAPVPEELTPEITAQRVVAALKGQE